MIEIITDFARGGGGGSGGGGSGGGGGVLFVLGYIPMHFIGSQAKKRIKSTLVASILVWPVAIAYAVFWFYTGGIGSLVGVLAIVGAAAGLYGWFDKVRGRIKSATTALSGAAAKDAAWSPEKLNKLAAQVFVQFQSDWSASNSNNYASYMTPWFAYKNQLLSMALLQLSRKNIIENPVIESMNIIDVVDSADDSRDTFTMYIKARSSDVLVDTRSNNAIFSDNSSFEEYWRFVRSGNTWLLDGIDQQTADAYAASAQLQAFASANNMSYSLDMGWLLLPSNGQLFGQGKFGHSDINNHVIGIYSDVLVQIYSYIPVASNPTKSYLIAQMALPKSYGQIVVRRKKMLQLDIKGLDKYQMESVDFNKKYEVFASTAEGPTSFELLHPVFMEKLEALPFEVNIEVVDNTVYLYAAEQKTNIDNYQAMLVILKDAFLEMRM